MRSLVQTSTMDIQFSVFVLLIMDLNIVTYNANGLLDHHKWKEVFALAKAKNMDIFVPSGDSHSL